MKIMILLNNTNKIFLQINSSMLEMSETYWD